MLIPSHVVDIYQDMINAFDAELIVENDKVIIDAFDGKIIIYADDGFIDHMNFHGGPYKEELINVALLLVNKIAPFERISEKDKFDAFSKSI